MSRTEWAGGVFGASSTSKKEKVQPPPLREAAKKTPSSCRLIGGGRIGVEESAESAESTTASVNGGTDR